jgi:flagella basal body P-ring formation protein FlgA
MIFLVAIAMAADPGVALQEAVAARLEIGVEDVKVQRLNISGAPADATWQVQLPTGRCWGGISVRLDGTTPDGKVRHYTAYTTISAWDQVPVADHAVEPGGAVSYHLERQQLDLLTGEPVAEGRWRARVNLHEGEPLVQGRVELMPDALLGSPVEIRVHAGSLFIKAPGQLTTDAWVGQPVQVMNLATHTVLSGIYEAEGRVRIGATP